jgi:hypothetical protein
MKHKFLLLRPAAQVVVSVVAVVAVGSFTKVILH